MPSVMTALPHGYARYVVAATKHDMTLAPHICLCLHVVTTILWSLRLPVVLLHSKRLMRPVVYQTRYLCTNVGHASEQIIADSRTRIGAAIDARISADPPSCNGVCCIMEQASRATQEEWLLICVTWAMLHSVSFLSTALLNEPEAFASTVVLMFSAGVAALLQSRLIIATGAWQQHEATTTVHRTLQQTSQCSTSTAELFYLRHCRACAATASGNKGGHPGQSNPLMIAGAIILGSMLQQMCTILLSPIYKPVHSIWRTRQRVTKSMMKHTANLLAILQSALELAQAVASEWISPLELAACLHLASFDIQCEP